VSYKVRLKAKAEAEYDSLPPELQEAVEAGIARLARDPLRLGRRVVSPPYPPGGQMYPFDYQEGTLIHHFVVFYVFGLDEDTLVVTSIGRTS
jgi:hypothetical protein